MGIDVEIAVQMKPGTAPTDAGPIGDFTDDLRWVEEYFPNATHTLSSGVRYYSEHYERGPWPQIAALLLGRLRTRALRRA